MPDTGGAVLGVGFLILWIYCTFDVITTDEALIPHRTCPSSPGSSSWCFSRTWAPGCGWAWGGRGSGRVGRTIPNRQGGYRPDASEEEVVGPNPTVQYREYTRLRLREEQLNRREEELRPRELGRS
jgi:hypothetical protein